MRVSPDRGTTVVVPNWNGRGWLPLCLESIAAQTIPPAEIVIVDNGSTDGSQDYLRREHPHVRLLELGHNTGFAHAVNVGVAASAGELVALVNTDVVLAREWLSRMGQAIASDPRVGSVACKMLSLQQPAEVYDAGDILRRDGACEQRGRFLLDAGNYDAPGEIFGACAGAALYRRAALDAVEGFDEGYFAYLEDVDLALRLRLAGWTCRYEPVVAHHAGEGSSHRLAGGHTRLVERNTLLLVAKAFPARWLPLVAYRQLGWLWHALRDGTGRMHLRGAIDALPALPAALRARRRLRREAVVSIEVAVPARPFRGPSAGGHASARGRMAAGRTGSARPRQPRRG